MTIISDGTFAECTGLTSITIPKNVKLINNDAFRRCTGLTSIYCLGTKEEYAMPVPRKGDWPAGYFMKIFECIAKSGNTGKEIVVFVRAVDASQEKMNALVQARQQLLLWYFL